jgi:putative ABC transport system ATP-binding protein
MIEVVNITKRYLLDDNHEVWALRDVCCFIQQGSWTTISGPSGSGKSSLLALMAALDRPTAGQVLVDGHDICFASDVVQAGYRKKKIGIVFQEYQLLEELNALENVAMPLVVTSMKRSEREARAQEVLNDLGLDHRIKHLPRQLSGGERQRVAIARALVQEPAIIFADEPTSNIDETSADQVFSLFDQLEAAGRTLVVVSHDPRLVERADQRINLYEGRIVE